MEAIHVLTLIIYGFQYKVVPIQLREIQQMLSFGSSLVWAFAEAHLLYRLLYCLKFDIVYIFNNTNTSKL